jgi:hypothetical protein
MTGGCLCGAIRYVIASFFRYCCTPAIAPLFSASLQRLGDEPFARERLTIRRLVPVAHTFMRSAQPWALPAANAECRESGPKDFRRLVLARPAIWPEFSRKNSSIFAEPSDGHGGLAPNKGVV